MINAAAIGAIMSAETMPSTEAHGRGTQSKAELSSSYRCA